MDENTPQSNQTLFAVEAVDQGGMRIGLATPGCEEYPVPNWMPIGMGGDMPVHLFETREEAEGWIENAPAELGPEWLQIDRETLKVYETMDTGAWDRLNGGRFEEN